MSENGKNKSISPFLRIVSRSLPIILIAVLLPMFGGCITPRVVDGESSEEVDAMVAGAGDSDMAPRDELKMRPPGPGLPVVSELPMAESRPEMTPREVQPGNDSRPSPSLQAPPVPLEVDPDAPYRLKVGDPVLIVMRGTLGDITDFIDETGSITLPFVDKIEAVGLTGAELEAKIQGIYVPDYFKFMTVNVVVATMRSYFLRGEFRVPGRVPYIGGTTLLEAVSAAGGFTQFANARKITITRGTQITTVNFLDIVKNPDKDVAIEAGDIIFAPRKIW